MTTPAAGPPRHLFLQFARQCLAEALAGLDDNASEVLGAVELALMALTHVYGGPETITLHVADVVEYLDPPDPRCICPPGLVARDGFRSGCPQHAT